MAFLCVLADPAWAAEGIFFGATGGLGVPRIDHPQLDTTSRSPYGLVVAGIALTEGKVDVRLGGTLSAGAGYRWALGRWASMAAEAGAHVHLYENGSAVFPYAGVHLRVLRRDTWLTV